MNRLSKMTRNLILITLLFILLKNANALAVTSRLHPQQAMAISSRRTMKSKCSPIVCHQSRDSETIVVDKTPEISQSNNRPSKLQNFGNSNDNQLDNGDDSTIPGLGLLVLCSVPLVWGTYVPIVRLLYEIDPPIPGFLFSVFYFLISSVTTVTLAQILDRREDTNITTSAIVENSENDDRTRALAGLELGSWLFLGNTLQLLGLKTVPSDRAGFLVQMTTILVPLVSALLAGNILAVDATTWVACCIALAGIVVMNVDLSNIAAASAACTSAITAGDGLILSAALMYTMHVIRLGKWAPSVSPLQLAASKSTVETILSAVLVTVSIVVASTLGATSVTDNLVLSFLQDSGKELLSFFDIVSGRVASGTLSTDSVAKAVGATFWAGWVGTA